MLPRPAALAALLTLALAPPTPAQEGPSPDALRSCVTTAADQGKSPAACIDSAQAGCLRIPADTPAVASLCFEEHRAAWSEAIATRMQTLRDSAPDRVASLAGIEVKYDMMAALVQCNRMEELALLRELPPEEIRLQTTRCRATAAGLAYIRLLWRLPDPGPQTQPDEETDR